MVSEIILFYFFYLIHSQTANRYRKGSEKER